MHTKYSMKKNQEISEQDFIWEQFDNLFGPISKDMKVETLPQEVEKLEVKRIRFKFWSSWLALIRLATPLVLASKKDMSRISMPVIAAK